MQKTRAALVVTTATLIVVAVLAAYQYALIGSLEDRNSNLGSTIGGLISQENSSEIAQSWLAHMSNLDEKTYSATINDQDYIPGAEMTWSGDTRGLGATYDGIESIRFAFGDLEQGSKNLTITVTSHQVTTFPNGTGQVIGSFFFEGYSNAYEGNFNGTVSSDCHYIYQDGLWLISQEDWNFETYYQQGSPL